MHLLRALDLNLLVSLHALISERNVTRAAAELGTSQPAMSRTLARLRELFDDPLLVRVGRSMQPTPRALGLFEELSEVLGRAHALFEAPEFDPSSATGEIRFAAPDIVVLMLVPELLRRLAREAPQLRLRVVDWDYRFIEQLESGDVDLTIGGAEDRPGLYARLLIENEWACVLRRGHPALKKRWTPRVYAALEHMLVTFSGQGGGHVDEALARMDLSRRIKLHQPYAAISPLLIAETDLVLTTARWLASRLNADKRLVLRRPPVALDAVRLELLWHERSHRDPRQRWVRALLFEVARDAYKTGGVSRAR